MKWMSGTWIFCGFGVTCLGFLNLVTCALKSHTFRVYAFHWYHWFTIKLYSCRLCAGYLKTTFLALTPPTSEIFTTPVSANHTFLGFPPRSWRSTVYNWRTGVMVRFRYWEKWSHFHLSIHRSGSYWTHKCIPYKNRSLPNRLTFARMVAEKPVCFSLTIEDSYPQGIAVSNVCYE